MRSNNRASVLNAVFGAIALNMINPYIGLLAIRLGADDLQVGYLSSWPAAFTVVAVLGLAAAVARSAYKQRLIAAILLIGRLAALGAATVPWFPESMRVWALIGFWVLAVFPASAAGTAMQSFLADVFPSNDRARVLASRQSWATGAGMVTAFVTGWMLDRLFPYPQGYQIMFAGSFVFAVVEVYYFLRLREDPAVVDSRMPAPAPGRVGIGTYLAVLTRKEFRMFIICSLLFHFTWQMAWPIFTKYQASVLMTNNTWQSLVTVANSLVGILTYPIWARYADRYGNKLMLFVAALWLATAPVLTALAPSMLWVVLLNLFTGIGVAGVMLLILNNLLEVSPSDGRPIFLAVHTALVSLSAFIAPMAGAYLMSTMEIRLGLILCSILRLASSALFLWLWLNSRGVKGIQAAVPKA